MEKNQKQLSKQAKELNKITWLFENLAEILKQNNFYEAYHFIMISKMSFKDVTDISSNKKRPEGR